MDLTIIALVLLSATIHPFWNMLLKKNPNPQAGFFVLSGTMSICGLVHAFVAGSSFAAMLDVIPQIAMSVGGLLLYGLCLAATLRRGDLSAYYPVIRASPVFVVLASVILLGKSYPLIVLLGIAMAVIGGFVLLYRRGKSMLDDPGTLGLALLAMAGTGIYSLADASMMQVIDPQMQVFIVNALLLPFYGIAVYRNHSADVPLLPRPGLTPILYFFIPGLMAYASYYLILLSYQLGGDVASVTSVRQFSIPISVALGGLFLREGSMLRRFIGAGVLALGIVIIAIYGQ